MYLSSFKFTPCHDLACAQLVFWCVVYCTMPQKWKKNSAIFGFWKSSHWMANLSKLLLLFQFWAIFDDFSKRGVRRACPEGAWKIWKITQNWKKKNNLVLHSTLFSVNPITTGVYRNILKGVLFWRVWFILWCVVAFWRIFTISKFTGLTRNSSLSVLA